MQGECQVMKGRDWSAPAVRHGMPRNDSDHQKLRKVKVVFYLESQKTNLANTLILGVQPPELLAYSGFSALARKDNSGERWLHDYREPRSRYHCHLGCTMALTQIEWRCVEVIQWMCKGT